MAMSNFTQRTQINRIFVDLLKGYDDYERLSLSLTPEHRSWLAFLSRRRWWLQWPERHGLGLGPFKFHTDLLR